MEEKAEYKTRVRAKGQITVPKVLRERLGVHEGDDLVFYANEEGQVVVEAAKTIPPDQAWFWTERWQQMEREVQADYDAGRFKEFDNVEDLIADLNDGLDADD